MQQQQQQPQQLPIANSLPVAVPSGASTITSTRGHQAPAPVLIPQELSCFGLSTAPAAAGGTGTGIGALASSGGSFTRIKSKGRFTISEGDGGAPLCIVRATSPASASAPASVHAAAAPGSFDNDLDLGLLSSRSAPSGPCYIDPRASFEGPPGWPVSHPVPGTAGAGLSLPPASVLHADVNTAAGLVEAWPAGPPAAGTLLEQLPQSAAAPVAARGLPQQAQSQSALQLRLPQQDVPEQLGATQVQSDHGVPLQGDSAVQVQQEMERLVRERMRMYEERTAVLQDAANAADRQDSDQAPDDGDHAGPAVHAVHAAGPGQAQVLNLDVQIYNMQHASIAVDAAAGAGNGHGADAYMVDVDIHALQGEDPADAVQQPMHGSDSDESDSVMMEYEGAQGEDFDEVAMPNTPRPY